MVTIATWNVNSIKARFQTVHDWLARAAPDIALLQEVKCEAAAFPAEPLEDLGYNVVVAGQKAYNGVAILSKRPLAVVTDVLPGDPEDSHARYLEADIGTLRVACLYLPNGNPPGNGQWSDKFRYKLTWMDRLRQRAADLLAEDHTVIWGGDFNVIPEPEDCHDPAVWEGDALYRPETRRAFRSLLNLGLTEAYRALHHDRGAYTFWDYQGGAWQMDRGIRIDHFLLSPQAADRLVECRIDRAPRGEPKASDHTPVLVTIEGD
ncbi:MAG: exodeoxyribonuclease III [Rhodospirillaceae bacterium]|nr:exodeoxyribonuclease III [Rhodospirillaceae bacterium]